MWLIVFLVFGIYNNKQEEALRIAESRKKRSFKKFTFRGIDLDKLLDLKPDELLPLVSLDDRLNEEV